ncbi:EbsA family protein, partial [Staphylococcus epidermidis]
MQKTTTAFYQPNYAYFVTIWSWIGFVYTLALIVQLELINLNWQSWGIGLIAVWLTLWVIFGHRVSMTADVITLKRPVFKYN